MMRKWLPGCATALTMIMTVTSLQAQTHPAVVLAEQAFAQHAVDHSMRLAFLHYADSNGVVFVQGKALNALKAWGRAPESPIKLLWHPAYAAMAASGDLGFTTGPFEVRNSMNDTATSAGNYTTIWKKNNNGEWKFLADLGTEYAPSLYSQQGIKQGPALLPALVGDTSMLQTEQRFIDSFRAKGLAAYASVLMSDSWFNIDGEQPKTNPQAIEAALGNTPADILFTPLSAGMSSSRDLGYVYGTVQYKDKKENYLRVWAHTANGWKVLVQVLKWQR